MLGNVTSPEQGGTKDRDEEDQGSASGSTHAPAPSPHLTSPHLRHADRWSASNEDATVAPVAPVVPVVAASSWCATSRTWDNGASASSRTTLAVNASRHGGGCGKHRARAFLRS